MIFPSPLISLGWANLFRALFCLFGAPYSSLSFVSCPLWVINLAFFLFFLGFGGGGEECRIRVILLLSKTYFSSLQRFLYIEEDFFSSIFLFANFFVLIFCSCGFLFIQFFQLKVHLVWTILS